MRDVYMYMCAYVHACVYVYVCVIFKKYLLNPKVFFYVIFRNLCELTLTCRPMMVHFCVFCLWFKSQGYASKMMSFILLNLFLNFQVLTLHVNLN
jgi:hypothetical protein